MREIGEKRAYYLECSEGQEKKTEMAGRKGAKRNPQVPIFFSLGS